VDELEHSPEPDVRSGGSRIVRREVLLLVIIAVAAVPLYLFTFRMAEVNRQRNSGIAAALYRQAQRQLSARDITGAIESLRQAVTNDRNDRRFTLALATTLAEAGQDEEARNALLRLRDATPEDPNINLQLARLAARQGDLAEATRYYHHSLYGIWTGADVEARRRDVRVELIRLLISKGERNQALGELLVMSSEAPNTASDQVDLARQFEAVGDSARALEHFLAAAGVEPTSFEALRGAGEMAFRIGDYRAAAKYLSQALARAPDAETASVAGLLNVAQLVDTMDPLAPRISSAERVRRLSVALELVSARLAACSYAEKRNGAYGPLQMEKLQGEAATMRDALTMSALRRDPELLRVGTDLVFSIEETAASWCGEPEGADRALLLAGRKHEGGER
jgi:tetratricopeptide (TPR) repeat protein